MPETRVNNEVAFLLSDPKVLASRRTVKAAMDILGSYMLHPDTSYLDSAISLLKQVRDANTPVHTP